MKVSSPTCPRIPRRRERRSVARVSKVGLVEWSGKYCGRVLGEGAKRGRSGRGSRCCIRGPKRGL